MSERNGVGVTVIGHDSESRTRVKDVIIEGVIHVTFITPERVCLSWRVSPEPPHTVNSLSNMNVIIQCFYEGWEEDTHGGCHVTLLR